MESEKNQFEVVEYKMKRLSNTLSSFIPAVLMPKKKCRLRRDICKFATVNIRTFFCTFISLFT